MQSRDGRRVCMGAIAGPHGVRGAVRVHSFTADPSSIAAYGPLTDEAGRIYVLKPTGTSRGAILARIDGIEDRDQAAALSGTRLYVSRDALPSTGADEYYLADLIGLAVDLSDGSRFGTVRAVHDFGAGACLEVAGNGGEIVVPFNRRAVPVVDLTGGRLVVDPPASLDLLDPGDADQVRSTGTA